MKSSGMRPCCFWSNKTSLDPNERGAESVRISRNKLGYYSGFTVVPSDVGFALGTRASVGKVGEEKGGEPVPGESAAEVKRDCFIFFIQRGKGSAVMLELCLTLAATAC